MWISRRKYESLLARIEELECNQIPECGLCEETPCICGPRTYSNEPGTDRGDLPKGAGRVWTRNNEGEWLLVEEGNF